MKHIGKFMLKVDVSYSGYCYLPPPIKSREVLSTATETRLMGSIHIWSMNRLGLTPEHIEMIIVCNYVAKSAIYMDKLIMCTFCGGKNKSKY